jgi:hypothetical protein
MVGDFVTTIVKRSSVGIRWKNQFHGTVTRVARLFLVKRTKTGKNIPNDHKIYQIATKFSKLPQNLANCHKI